jgi:hypothetical protein
MSRRVSSPSPEAQDVLRALRRAAKRALEIGLATGTPVWVVKKGKMVDLTKEQPASKKASAKHSTSKKRSK